MNCQSCKYWKPLVAQKGRCRRHVPVLLQTKTDPIGVWPQTSMYDWCGEYESVGTQDPPFEPEEEAPIGSNAPTVTVSQDWSVKS